MLATIGTFFCSLFSSIGQWFGKVMTNTTPQRADFEAVNNHWKALAESISEQMKKLMDERDAEHKRERLHDRRRIAELEKEAEECRRFRAEDFVAMDKLRSQIRSLQEEVLSLKSGT